MYAEGETELRDLIVQNLESCGFLNKIKAEMRAGVFLAFEEEGNLRSKISLFNKKFDDFIETPDGKVAVSIVREFLDYFDLHFSLSVFDPEIATSSPCLTRSELFNNLNLKNSEFDGPVISALLKTKVTSEFEKKLLPLNMENSSLSGISSHKSLETISEDSPTKDKNGYGILSKDNTSTANFPSLTFDDSAKSKQMKENIIAKSNVSTSDTFKMSNSSLIDKLKNELLEVPDKEKPSITDIFTNNSSSSILKEKVNSSGLDDPFFDDPVPSENPNFFSLPSESSLNLDNFKDDALNKSSSNLSGTEKNTLSSLKNLPSLTTKSKDWSYSSSAELSKPLSGFDITKSEPISEISDNKETNSNEELSKKDPESNEESSDRQMNSDESIEEQLEEDFSTGIDDLLNSSLSLGDDATSDQTVSQISIVDGIDHIEPVKN